MAELTKEKIELIESVREELDRADMDEALAGIAFVQYKCWETAQEHGWHEEVDDKRMFVEKLCLIHSELSEALEEYRDGRGYTEIYHKEGKPEGIPIELADVAIRLFDLAGIYGIDLAGAISIKQQFNNTRPYRHGDRKA